MEDFKDELAAIEISCNGEVIYPTMLIGQVMPRSLCLRPINSKAKYVYAGKMYVPRTLIKINEKTTHTLGTGRVVPLYKTEVPEWWYQKNIESFDPDPFSKPLGYYS